MTTTSHTRVGQAGAPVGRARAAPRPRAGARPSSRRIAHVGDQTRVSVRLPARGRRAARFAGSGAVRAQSEAAATRIGVDLVDVGRFTRLLERRGSDLRDRVFTTHELRDCRGAPERLAGRFAAKEAAAKALGTGIGPIGWRDIEVRTGPRGAPSIRLHGRAATLAHRLGLAHWAVSLSHDADRAVAVVVAERGA